MIDFINKILRLYHIKTVASIQFMIIEYSKYFDVYAVQESNRHLLSIWMGSYLIGLQNLYESIMLLTKKNILMFITMNLKKIIFH